ncbi:MAG: glycosyltransferase family 2 protein [Burkholderiales bacterium]|nr:MAG: glycosyltransferase family 2 protein [Burkholderiales bacterium]
MSAATSVLERPVAPVATPPIDLPAAPLVSAVMPCLNEARTIGDCIRKAQACMRELGIDGEVVVADNGSSDRSVEIARALGARVVHQPVPGYGAALRAGIEAARGEIIIMADSDDSYDWGALGPFVDKIREGYDLVMGNRFAGGIEDGAMPALHRYLGNPVLSLISRIAFRAPIGDFHCGMRAFTREAFRRMGLRSNGMEFATEMVAGSAYSGLRMAEIPIRLYPDNRGRPPHLRSFRDGWRHLRLIATYAPDHLYLWPGSVLFAAGIALMSLLLTGPFVHGELYLGIHFLVLGGLCALLGANVLLMGILAKAAVSVRYPALASPLLKRLKAGFTLERGLVLGGSMIVAGFVFDATLLARWIGSYGIPMDDTVHPAFVATITIVLGVNLVFGSFLMHLMLKDEDRT